MLWANTNSISIIFSQKSDGDLLFKTRNNAEPTQNNAEKLNDQIRQNRVCFFEKNKIDPKRLVNIVGVHGTNITMTRHSDLRKGALDPETRIKDTDGLITNIKNSYLMITGADCFPVFFWESVKNVIGIAHCGWKGILAGLPSKMVKKLKDEFGSNPADIQVWLGPGIKSCHFEVQNDVSRLFEKNFKSAIINRDDKIFIDLTKAIMLPLMEAGVKTENITEHPDCTYCEKEKWFSYRRDKFENPEPVEEPRLIEANAFIINLK